jgi:uncharacterized protein (DUF849 family)
MFLEAAINGARAPAEHPRVPIHPDELAGAAVAAVGAGARAVHFESLSADDVARSVVPVRSACGAPVGISTGGWIEPDPDRRLAVVRAWRVLPDFVSVNFDEDGAEKLAGLLLSLGIAVEAGLAAPAGAERLMASGIAVRCLRVLLEPAEASVPAALGTVAEVESLLASLAGTTPRLLHGTGATTWPLFVEAVRRGYEGRIGLEDTLLLPDGTAAADNEDLIRAARWISD